MTIEIFVENSHELLDNQWNWTDETNSKKKTIQYDEIKCEKEFLLCFVKLVHLNVLLMREYFIFVRC